jgi:transposase
MSKAVFKPYHQNQSYLIPPSWEEKISETHPVRLVSKIIDSLDLQKLYTSYEGGGSSSYDPKMLLKGLVYSYMLNIYSSRRIEDAIKSNIYLIWLCGGNEPDHNTINRFRSSKIETYLKDIFKQIVLLLASEGLLSLQSIFIDGTKMEANANRYTFAWGKSIKNNKEKIGNQIDAIWEYTQRVASEELSDTDPVNFHEIDSTKLKETIAKIENALKDKEIPKEVKHKLQYAKKNYPEKLAEYELKEEILNGRNSYSKTDPDATFMRMKEDHLGNGQLKPAYNVQISTNNQMITNYDIYSNPNDTLTLPSHIDNHKEMYGEAPEKVITDSGYGSEQNYQYLEQNAITAYVKYNHFHQEESGTRQKKYPFSQDYLYYNEEEDYYICPMGQRMYNKGVFKQKNESGFEQTITKYEAQNCTGCPVRGRCHKGQGNRIIEVNHRLNRYKKNAKEKLKSDEGLYYRKQRGIDTEPVFGNLKHNKNFRRFSLRGKRKVEIEFGLFAIAHNLKKRVA